MSRSYPWKVAMTKRARCWRMSPCAKAIVVLLVGLTAGDAMATGPVEAAESVLSGDYSPALRTFLALSMLSIIPVLIIGMTSFTRIVIVLSLLRHALGLPQTPPNSVIITLAICLTYFTMAPTLDGINQAAITPYLSEQITMAEALEHGSEPLRNFMVAQTHESDLQAVMAMAREPMPTRIEDIKFSHLMPAFLLSELKTAFQIGFVIFLPFLLLDLVVGAVLMALGMIMVPPATVSLPLKILLFVLIDGWVLVSNALLSSYWN